MDTGIYMSYRELDAIDTNYRNVLYELQLYKIGMKKRNKKIRKLEKHLGNVIYKEK